MLPLLSLEQVRGTRYLFSPLSREGGAHAYAHVNLFSPFSKGHLFSSNFRKGHLFSSPFRKGGLRGFSLFPMAPFGKGGVSVSSAEDLASSHAHSGRTKKKPPWSGDQGG